MKIQTIKIPDAVAAVLQRSSIDGLLLHLPDEQLERKLYADTAKVLKALGITWSRSKAAHVLPANDIADELRTALKSGTVVDRKKTLQLFETPVDLANEVASSLMINPASRCLEPSAGLGRIVAAMQICGAVGITAIEIDAANVASLRAQAIAGSIIEADFLTVPVGAHFDAIGMNPPFTGNQDVRHVRHAFDHLAPGGRLTAIMSAHGFHGLEREAVQFREWVEEVGAQVDVIPAGSFKESGTAIETRLVKIIKRAVV